MWHRLLGFCFFFFFSSRRRHTRYWRDWSSDVCSSDLNGEGRVLLGHILPNIMPIMIVQMSLTMGYAILNAAGLSFIGLGVRPPTAEWGIMVAEGAGFMVSGEWWIALFPGLALMIAVFCFNLLGDGLRDIVDPQRRT